MENTSHADPAARALPFVLIVAVLQGWALYGLHHAVVDRHWPATQPQWLFAFYGLALFVPVTLQLLAGFERRKELWSIVAGLATAYFYFGWHHGTSVHLPQSERLLSGNEDGLFALGIEACVLWLMIVPFVQARLLAGRWNAHYPTLFSSAWHNALVLAEAVLFTGLFWLLLGLWASLFHMLGIDFFRELFQEPIFIYPVTALTFGVALRLIGSIDRLTSVVLEQILNVLKWLALVAGFILTLFTLALIAKLPGLLASGQRVIGAAWLLWLVAVIVLLLNAAYRDGTIARPYPRVIAQMLRWIVPLTVVVALTAIYALWVRTDTYGLTVERVWAFIVAGAAAIYSVGYAVTVFDRNGWLPGISRINVIAALALIATIACALTPVLSPYRLAANSQFEIAQQPLRVSEAEHGRYRSSWQSTSFQYLRFSAGRYGLERLERLASLEAGPEAQRIRKSARIALDQEHRGQSVASIDPDSYVAGLRLFPRDRTLDQALVAVVVAAIGNPRESFAMVEDAQSVGLFIDLNDDAAEEFVVMNPHGGLTFTRRGSEWTRVGRFSLGYDVSSWKQLLRDLDDGKVEAVAPQWRELKVGSRRARVVPQE